MARNSYQVIHTQKVGGFTLTLEQKSVDRFAVQYGQQRKENLPYSVAAKEFGACLMHGLALDSKLITD